jgi:hypothetical protein
MLRSITLLLAEHRKRGSLPDFAVLQRDDGRQRAG